jgi:hypothetical protein
MRRETQSASLDLFGGERPVPVAEPSIVLEPTVPRSTARRVRDGDAYHLVHDCGLCSAPMAAFGYGVSELKGQPGYWLCAACVEARAQ